MDSTARRPIADSETLADSSKEAAVSPKAHAPFTEAEYVQIQAMLSQSLLFQGATEIALKFIVNHLQSRRLHKGEPVILQNESANEVYFIKSGSVEVVRYDYDLRLTQRLAVLKSGEHFSEFSVLTGANRSASVFALEDSELLFMDGSSFITSLQKFPLVAKQLASRMAQMNKDLLTNRIYIPLYHPALLKPTPALLRIFPLDVWMRFEAFPLSCQGSLLQVAMTNPYNLQFLKSLQDAAPGNTIEVLRIRKEDLPPLYESFNPKSFSHSSPNPSVNPTARPVIDLLRSNPTFSDLPESILNQLAPHFKLKTFAPGEFLYKANTPSEFFYVLESGRARVTTPLPNSIASIGHATLEAGACFPEISLLGGYPHILSIVALQPTRAYLLPKDIFLKLTEVPEFVITLTKKMARRLQDAHYGNLKSESLSLQTHELFSLHTLLPEGAAAQCRLIPLKLNHNELTLGLTSAADDSVFNLIGRHLGAYRIQFRSITESEYTRCLQAIENYKTRKIDKINKPRASVEVSDKDPVQLLDSLVIEGFNTRASDVHIEPFTNQYTLRFRIDGVLQEMGEKISSSLGKELINRIKVASDMDITQHFIPQDGQLKLKIGDETKFARVSVMPTKHGENAVLRLIRTQNSVIPLEMIAPDRRLIQILKEISQLRQGLFLVTGPTGSGKSTSLYSLLAKLNAVDLNVLTLEDPVEMELSGLSQVQINEKTGLTFAKALRSSLRQDPDVIMVGEVRDADSAKICFEAAITGHLVLSTLHTTSSLDILPRLKEFGLPSSLIASGLAGVMAQRLVRALCTLCAQPRPIKPNERDLLLTHFPSLTPPTHLREGLGCEHCHGSGFHGRIPVFEIWRKTPAISELLINNAPHSTFMNVVRKDGFVTLFEFGLTMASHGLTTIQEVERCISRLN